MNIINKVNNDNDKKIKENKKEGNDSIGDKNYVLKLMVDEYYGEIEKNLLSVGGLTD